MEKQTTKQASPSSHIWKQLEVLVREHVQHLIQALLEEAVTAVLGRPASVRRRHVDALAGYRNGHGKPRRLAMSLGTVTAPRPRVRGLSELLPHLYLHGLALRDFDLALPGLLGDAAPLSAASLTRLKGSWQLEYEAWKQRRLDNLEVVYVWADGLYVKVGLEDTKSALLVIIGALTNACWKMVLAVESGQWASKESWGAVLRDLCDRGLKPWRCTLADGHLEIWTALAEQQPTAAKQRCWNHRITNVLDAIPTKQQAQARIHLCTMSYAESQEACEQLRTHFVQHHRQLAPKTIERLLHDWERLVTFY